ncbi:hypothetical protein Tco_1085620 [Tanacetum coccineum]
MVRAATTASSLEAEHDSGKKDKTESKATPNKSTSSGGPRCQDTMGDTIDQTGVLDLETAKTSQQNEIASLKRRVKKIEQKKRSRTHGLKRLRKVGATSRVESSGDEESLGEDASKQGRIDAIDADEEITLVNVQNVDEEMLDVNVLDVSAASDKVSTANAATTINVATTTTANDLTLAQALQELKSTKPKVKGIAFSEQCISTTTISSQQLQGKSQSQDKGKGKMIEEPMKPMKKKAKIDADHQLAERLQAQEQEELSIEEKSTLFQQLLEKRRKHFAAKRVEEQRNKPPTKAQQKKIMSFKRINTFEDFRTELVEGEEKRAGEELIQESSKKQKVDDDKEIAELKQCMEIIPDKEEVIIDAIPLAVNQMLKSFDREDLEDLYKLVKARYGSTRPVESMDYLLWNDMKIMFEPHVEDEIYMLVDEKYSSYTTYTFNDVGKEASN